MAAEVWHHARFPEIDRAAWFTSGVAYEKLLRGQIEFLTQLCEEPERRHSIREFPKTKP